MLYAILIYGSDADEPTGAGRYAAAAKKTNHPAPHQVP